ncbi:protein CutA, chloroplastic-like isoform X3 [Salvia miltiorrhiza]|uniref:protein CutA, chloroplastic-like isoform X3 n=1 Tax=Salvia miltiorrhiza TaxID=226208 RepID=UPI0025AC3EBA|nr:protein CutA, chloroplastic-like isoform X3 [Salvia miltiorrhiza]
MALRLSSVISSTVVRRRLPLVGAFCVLSLGLSNLCTVSLSSRTGTKFGTQSENKKFHTVRMEASKTTVPSIVVYVTVPNKEAGKKLAESIVKERLAACVNRVPGVESVYEWKGEIQTDSEELLIIKTRESLLEALTEHVKANHEYEVPEVISLPITGGNLQYLEWIKNSTRD